MKTANFTNIYIENFGKHSEAIGGKTIANRLGRRTVISGSNACGKSTVKRAIQYVLGAKDENGKEIAGIRPHDKDCVDIDGLTTVVALEVSVDGIENTLQKTYFQKKNRQGEYTSENETQYFIDDVKKSTRKSYDEFVHTIIPDTVCISAQELLMKDTTGRRTMLEVFGKHDTDSVIDENPDFEPLRAKLKANTIADLKKACRDKIKLKTKERDAYPARIDEVEKQKVDIDLAELELLKNSLNEQIAEVKAKQEDISKEFEEQQKASDGILELKFELNGIQQKANEEIEKERLYTSSKQSDCQKELRMVEQRIKQNKQYIEIMEDTIKKNSDIIKICREDWIKASGRVFDENSLVCQYCGQEYPIDKKEQLRAEFESHKAEELETVTKRGNELKSAIDNVKADIKRLSNDIEKDEKTKSELETRIAKLETRYNAIPQSVDISDRPEVQEIQRQIVKKEKAMSKGNSAKEIRQKLQEEYDSLQRQLNEVEFKFLEAKKNDEIDTNIEKLRKEQRAKSQEIADIEKELDLLKSFERKKAELLESDINSNFNIIQWHMFKEQANGEFTDICSPFVNGTSYDGNLNKGARILVQLDICLSFQKLYDVQMPVLLDDGESIDSWRIPQVENQLIIFKRTDDKELKIECLEG